MIECRKEILDALILMLNELLIHENTWHNIFAIYLKEKKGELERELIELIGNKKEEK